MPSVTDILQDLKWECPHLFHRAEPVHYYWYENGPALSYLSFPIPDPDRPWGRSCKDCSGTCPGHYLKPEAHLAFAKSQGYDTTTSKPPSEVIKEKFYNSLKNNKELCKEELEAVAKQTLLPLNEVAMQVEHLRKTMKRRKKGAQKAALTRKKNKEKSQPKADAIVSDDSVSGKDCAIQWFYIRCLGPKYSPVCTWFCPDCQVATDLYCLCRQPEFGLMLACDKENCPIQWFHMQCVGLKFAPKGVWYCPDCESQPK